LTPGRRLLAFAGLFLALGAAGLVSSPSYLFSPALSAASKAVATVGVLAWWLLGLSAFAALRLVLVRPEGGPGRAALRWLFRLGAGGAFFFLLLSWVLHVRKGFFMNTGIFAFFAGDPIHMLALLTPMERRAAVVVLAAAAVLVALAVRLTAPPLGLPFGDRRVRGGAAALLGVAALALHGYPRLALSEADGGEYRKQACFHATPGLALLCSALPAAPREAAAGIALAPRYDGIEPYLETLPDPRPPARSLVLIVVESLRRDSLRALGAGDSYMPFLDELAGRSLLFSNAYSQSNVTHYSVTALLSSLYPMKYRDMDSFRGTGYPRTMIYDLLKGLGYRTSIFSSHNDQWGSMKAYLASPSLDEYFHAELYDGPTLVPKEDTGLFQAVSLGFLKKGSLDDRVTVDRFLGWLKEGEPARPFFTYLNFQATHFPYELAFDMETPFRPSTLDFEASFFAYPREKREVMLNRYRNSLRFVDARIRDVYEGVAAAGRAGETVFVVVGDHGQSFLEHGAVTHAQAMPEEVIRVPLLVAGPPDVVPVRRDDRPVQGVDVVPTVLALMGLPPHPNFQGANVLDPGRDPDDHALFLTTQNVQHTQVLVWRGFKYLLRREGQDSFFALRDDPGETRDLLRVRPGAARPYHDRLLQFVGTQLLYYDNPEYHRRFFPPKYE